ncbi:riboflavin transporter FmnP [Anaerosolibacter carboniphilus]|uniref:Riboflavin transporter n=1 Tax=Anaerosolibacter carboniphilus TaxID=1417629 RepID=A0A841KZ64_9FIRM|nr:ECF transporter S component [Anaerosolibacter carboniphilus]MBB6217608.1 riboflavin transporter FmnP [Anaerosolibacter carboniphilus]
MSNKITLTGQMTQKTSAKTLTKVSILSVLAYIIMLVEIPLFFFPSFLTIDLSDIPALIGGFTLGPGAAIAIQLVKNILHLVTKNTTGGVGELANFLVGSAFVVPASIIYLKNKTKHGAVLGMVVGILSMVIMGVIANYYITLPFYTKFMPMDKIIAMSAAANGAIVDMKTLILYAFVPFNILKGTVVSIITGLFYKKLSPILK